MPEVKVELRTEEEILEFCKGHDDYLMFGQPEEGVLEFVRDFQEPVYPSHVAGYIWKLYTSSSALNEGMFFFRVTTMLTRNEGDRRAINTEIYTFVSACESLQQG